MSESSNDYELNVLKMMVNKYLEEITSVTEGSLRELEVNCDQVVWDLATKIYSQSGHKIDLSIVRDVVNSRTQVIKYKLTAEAEQKARKAAEDASRIAIQEGLKAEQKARKAAEEASRIAIQKGIEAEQKAQKAAEEASRIAIQEAQLHAQTESILAELGGNTTKAQVFMKVRTIISDQFSVDENKVILSSHLSNDLRADDWLDFIELVMALEEEFDIDISDREAEDELGIQYGSGYSTASNSPSRGSSSSSGSFLSFLSISSSSLPSSVKTRDNCIVRSFVDLIHKKVHG